MTQGRPDVVVFELGDGILGAYGVEAILAEPDIRKALSAVVLSANDPVAAWGGVKLLRERFDIEPCAVTGPGHRQRRGREHHPGADGRARRERHDRRRRARRPHHREPRARRAARAGGVGMTRAHPGDRARRHRLRGRRAAAPARRAPVPRPRGRGLRQPARRAGRAVLPAPAAGAAAPALRRARRGRRVRHREPRDRGVLGRAARRVGDR